MTPPTRFVYALYDEQKPIGPESSIWDHALPVKRDAFRRAEDRRRDSQGSTYGDYFIAARTFLEKSPFLFPNLHSTDRLKPAKQPEAVEKISICLKKHGELYHPAKIEVTRGGQKNVYVLNLAVSSTGKRWAKREYQIMEKLGCAYSMAYIPRVYDSGASAGGSGQTVSIFLGDWFEGHHEFHLSFRSSNDPIAIRLWDAESVLYFLSTDQTLALYRQITRVLLYYYDVESTQQIFPWHHGAGDFIAKVEGDRVGVKLITTRGYSPLISNFNHHKEVNRVLDALLVFLLSVSIRMRLDRLDGVGEMVWSGDTAVNGVVDGFLKGLQQKSAPRFFPASLSDCFKAYLTGHKKSDFYDLFQSITNQYPLKTPEANLVKAHLTTHTEAFFHALTFHL